MRVLLAATVRYPQSIVNITGAMRAQLCAVGSHWHVADGYDACSAANCVGCRTSTAYICSIPGLMGPHGEATNRLHRMQNSTMPTSL